MSEKISQWLARLGLDQYADSFQKNAIEWDQLPLLSNDDLKEIGIEALGHRMLIMESIGPPRANTPITQEQKSLSPILDLQSGQKEAERRQITVMFCDLVGSTAMSESMDPERYREIITQYRSTSAKNIKLFDGFIAGYMGDGLLVYFGYPQAHEDDAERAVHAALAVISAVCKLPPIDEQHLQVRIGVATGIVVAGDIIGDDTTEENAILGDAPNLAARLQGVANPNEIVISESTRKLLRGTFALENLGTINLKGISAEVRPYKVSGERKSETRFAAKYSQGYEPIFGREQELTQLKEQWQQAIAGSGHAIVISGEAGIGKSQIVHSLLDSLSPETIDRTIYQCSPYHSDSALYPIVWYLSIAADFHIHDSDTQKLNKLQLLLGRSIGGDIEGFALLSELVGITDTVAPALGMSNYTPQKKRLKTLRAIIEYHLALSNDRPLLIVVEDAHWSDPTTLEMLAQLIDHISSARMMLLITSRLTSENLFKDHPATTHIKLNRLSEYQIHRIIKNITQGKNLPKVVVEEITLKADGSPLYVKEITKAVIESDELTETDHNYIIANRLKNVTVPSSLQDSLMARLDRLQTAKELAQIASCIGREFSITLLKALSNWSKTELDLSLSKLLDAQLIFQTQNISETTYKFDHALIREVAHNSLLKSQRKLLHDRIVEVLSSDPNTRPEVLAIHSTESDRIEDAIYYWQTAGQNSVNNSANLEAIEQLNSAISLLPKLSSRSESSELELEIRLLLGVAQQACLGYAAPAIENNYNRAFELCQESGDLTTQVPALRGLYIFHLMRGDLSRAHDFAQQLVDIAEFNQDNSHLVEAYFAIGQTRIFHMGDYDGAINDFEHAIGIYEIDEHGIHGYRFGQDPGVYCLQLLAFTLQIRGRPDAALEKSQQALALAEIINHPLSLASAYVFASQLHQWRDEPKLTRQLAELAFELSERQALPYFAGWARLLMGWSQPDNIEWSSMDSGLQMYADSGAGLGFTIASAVYAGAEIRANRFDSATTTLTKAIDYANHFGEPYILPELLRLLAQVQTSQNAHRLAVDSLKSAIAIANDTEALFWNLRIEIDRFVVGESENELRSVYDQFAEGFESPDLKRAQNLLSAPMS